MSIDDQQLARIEQALRHDHVYVDPSMRSTVPAATLAKVEQLARTSPDTVEVVVTPLSFDDPDYHGRPELLAGTIHSDLGGDAAYVLLTRSGTSDPGAVDVSDLGVNPIEANLVASRQHPHDPAAELLTTVRLIHDGTAAEAYQRMERPSASGTPSSPASAPGPTASSPSGASSTGPAWALGVTAVVVLVVVLAAARRLVQLRRQAGVGRVVRTGAAGAVTARPFTLPSAVLGHIRDTEEAEVARRADREVLALGERIDATEMTPSGNAAAWQAALDHYDLARRILDGEHGPADTVGAVVLAERGVEALRAATAGRPFRPTTPCFLDPLHGAGRPTPWGGTGGLARVPMCPACARAVRLGEQPDVLDFVVDGHARHYFDLDLPPWSTTGYGALDPDLTGALLRQRGRPGSGRRG